MLALSAAAWGSISAVAVLVLGVACLSLLLLRGRVAVDLGWGRSLHALGPISIRVAAPRDMVFEQIASPYLGRTPRDLRAKLEVLERGEDMALAAHHTKLRGFTATTVETVRFHPPDRVDFRLVRGPVPHVTEHFLLREVDGGTEIEYGGELGADLWVPGRLWARRVVRIWNGVVQHSLEGIKAGAEARARARTGRS